MARSHRSMSGTSGAIPIPPVPFCADLTSASDSLAPSSVASICAVGAGASVPRGRPAQPLPERHVLLRHRRQPPILTTCRKASNDHARPPLGRTTEAAHAMSATTPRRSIEDGTALNCRDTDTLLASTPVVSPKTGAATLRATAAKCIATSKAEKLARTTRCPRTDQLMTSQGRQCAVEHNWFRRACRFWHSNKGRDRHVKPKSRSA